MIEGLSANEQAAVDVARDVAIGESNVGLDRLQCRDGLGLTGTMATSKRQGCRKRKGLY